MLSKAEIKPMNDGSFYLQDDKVFLRQFAVSDINEIYISWLNDPDVVRFSNQRFIKHDYQSCVRYLSSFEDTENIFISVHCLPDKRPVGTMTAYVSKYHGTVDVGIMIGDKSIWGLGYGQSTWDIFTNWVFERGDIRKLTAGTLACNVGMIKIMERSGMYHETRRKAQEIINNEVVDILYYAKFNEE